MITKIGQLFIPNFDPRDELYPSSVCSQCRNILSKVQDKENVILPIPFDFSTISASKLTRSKDFCQCLICNKARQMNSLQGRPNHQAMLVDQYLTIHKLFLLPKPLQCVRYAKMSLERDRSLFSCVRILGLVDRRVSEKGLGFWSE